MSQIAGNMDARSEVNLDDSTTRRLGDLVAVLRPSQWAKNVFVLVPVLFSEKAFYRDELLRSVIATACFCLLSSVVYITNDLIDRPADRSHPRKRRRPIASGRVGAGTAVGLAVALVLVSTGVGSLSLPRPFLGFALAYLVNSMAYCFWLKNEVILDVIVISLGFVLRLLAGCAAIGVEPSSWIIVCGFNLALVLGFGKRRSELNVVDDPGGFRRVLLKYTPSKCDILLASSTAVCLVSYALYTVSPETIALHRTSSLVYTTPIVAYGLYRYLFKVLEGAGDGPSEILAGDPVFLVTILAWVLAVVGILAAR